MRTRIVAFACVATIGLIAARGHCGDLDWRIHKEYPGYTLFDNLDFEKYILAHSSSPAVVFGHFRGVGPEFAALIHTRTKGPFKNTALFAYDAKLVICKFQVPWNCLSVLDFEAIVPYQARVIVVPPDKLPRCESGGQTYKNRRPVVALWNDDKTGLQPYVFQNDKFIACATGE